MTSLKPTLDAELESLLASFEAGCANVIVDSSSSPMKTPRHVLVGLDDISAEIDTSRWRDHSSLFGWSSQKRALVLTPGIDDPRGSSTEASGLPSLSSQASLKDLVGHDRAIRALTETVEMSGATSMIACTRHVETKIRGVSRSRSTCASSKRTAFYVQFGYSSVAHYAEAELAMSARQVRDRIRVMKALDHLPKTLAVFREGKIWYSAVREITRVATPASEEEWIRTALAHSIRDLERMVKAPKGGKVPKRPSPGFPED